MNQARTATRIFFYCLLIGVFTIGTSYIARAQSQALNGQIEGTITDASGGAVPSAKVVVKNTQTGTERTVVADGNGVYRAPLLPLGTYQVTVEAPNYKRLVREGITLTTGRPR